MRILLACHEPPAQDGAALDPSQLAAGLARAGHEVRLWDASAAVFDDGPAPCFANCESNRRFEDLSTTAIDGYLDAARRQLDDLVVRFDPDIIHADYLWLLAYLALESGVPYVASVRGPELAAYRRDSRFECLVQQAAENAGRLFIASPAVTADLVTTLGQLEAPAVMLRPGTADAGPIVAPHYHQVRESRCGLFTARP